MQRILKHDHKIMKTLQLILLLLIFPLLPITVSPAYGTILVMIDPAHDGLDKGVRFSDQLHEKDITLAIAHMVQKELASAPNVRVQLTRDPDKPVSIGERTRIVRNAAPDIFVSLHVNAGFEKKASGFEIYFPGFKRQNKSEKEDLSIIVKDMERNKYLNDSVRFAYSLQKNLEQVFPRRGRGLREASVPILEEITKPAVVIELGFVTNSEDKKQLADKNIQLSIAKAISKSIRDLF
ncbi:MAG: N-acetylmuramoyl-L-alanine amidase AmiB precursor [Syntrophus sp. PtaB.Bin001]|jgi:N-acetylmuramoyl-L-alanine amidase|nr:MAG: N-acetylmuramoyl-L-alanine amidase AmiB precursor [Syntrophus sp. PtaB.Bin001]